MVFFNLPYRNISWVDLAFVNCNMPGWQSSYASACRADDPGANPGPGSAPCNFFGKSFSPLIKLQNPKNFSAMTNFWLGIPVENLCDQHLLGLHKEIHQEAGTIENHPHGEAIMKSHYRLAQVDTTELCRRHRQVAEEMKQRGMNHESPLEYEDRHGLIVDAFPIELFNRISLSSRCGECDVDKRQPEN